MSSRFKGLIHVIISLLVCGSSFAADPPPNILVILVDDLRYDALSVTGHPFFESPSIDRIANEGVNFSNSFITTPVCIPSRSTLLTGLYTFQHQVYNNLYELDESLESIGVALQENNYHTGLIGKWHVNRNALPKPGYDKWVSFEFQGEYLDPVFNVDGDTVQIDGYMTDILSDFALDFIRESASMADPFFLLLSHKAVHSPYIPNEDNVGMFSGEQIDLPETWHEDLTQKPEFVACRDITQVYDDERLRTRITDYLETLVSIETSTDSILQLLDSLGILDETLVIFSSDHGLHLGEHNLMGKLTAYEESIRIPLFCRYPAWFTPGTIVENDMALSLDIPRTILDVAGVESFAGMKGKSLRDLANQDDHRNEFMIEYYKTLQLPISTACTPSLKSIRTNKYKYIAYPGTHEIEELYDIQLDPKEITNLTFDDAFAQIVDSMRVRLDSLRFALGDTLLGIASIYVSDGDAIAGDTVDIPISIEFPNDSLIYSLSVSLSGFSNEFEYVNVRCFGSCLLQPADTWQLDVSSTDRLRINAWTETSGMSNPGVLFWVRAFIPEGSQITSLPLKIESALINNGQFPVRYETRPASGVQVNIIPGVYPVEVEPSGGQFTYEVLLQNTTSEQQQIIARLGAKDSNGSIYGPLAPTPVNIFLEPYELLTAQLTQFVPGRIAPGEYAFYCLLYDHLNTQIDSSGFHITKFPHDLVTSNHPDEAVEISDWKVYYSGVDIEVMPDDLWKNNGFFRQDGSAILSSKPPGSQNHLLPEKYILEQNYPNPFNPSTTIRYGLSVATDVTLAVYDIRGQLVQTLVSGSKPAGWFEVEWNSKLSNGKTISTGIYFARLDAADDSQVIKMLYLK